jgi:Family of unknown function (DUF5331)
VNTEELRQSVKEKWLNYYRENRAWVTRLATWGNYNGQRRPSSSFILASLSVLEPELPKLLPIMVELSNDPDRLVTVLGLNFNPENELKLLIAKETATLEAAKVKQLLPATTDTPAANLPLPEATAIETPTLPPRSAVDQDANCRGNAHRRLRDPELKGKATQKVIEHSST